MPALNGEIGFEAGGRSHTLKFDINTLCRLEDEMDLSVDEIIGQIQASPRLGFMRKIFWIGLLESEPELTEAGAGDLMTELTALGAALLITKGFEATFPAPEDAKGAANPRKAAAGTGRGSTKAGAA